MIKNNKWINAILSLIPLLLLQGCGPSSNSSEEVAPRILEAATHVHAFSEHEAESDMTLRAYFYVDHENGIDEIDYARVTFPDGTTYTLLADDNLFEHNGGHAIGGHFFMPSTGDLGEKSFAMHGYRVEVIDKEGVSTSQIFSIATSDWEIPPTGTRVVHPDDYIEGLVDAISAIEIPTIKEVTIYSDGVQVEVKVTDSRAAELQFRFANEDGEWFTRLLIQDSSELTMPGLCAYSVALADLQIDEGHAISDTTNVEVTVYAPRKTEPGLFYAFTPMGSSVYSTNVNTDSGMLPEGNCGDAS